MFNKLLDAIGGLLVWAGYVLLLRQQQLNLERSQVGLVVQPVLLASHANGDVPAKTVVLQSNRRDVSVTRPFYRPSRIQSAHLWGADRGLEWKRLPQ